MSIYCISCGSKNVVKKGIQNENQRYKCKDCGKNFYKSLSKDVFKIKTEDSIILDKLEEAKRLLKNGEETVESLANKLDISPKRVLDIIEKLKANKFNLKNFDSTYSINKQVEAGGFKSINLDSFENKVYKIGIISDNHLNSKYERLDVLNACYDIFEKEGITQVFNAGNWIEGERYNKYAVKNIGVSNQVEYFVDHYPKRKGICTYFIAGDDHEGWYQQDEGLIVGEYAEMMARQKGRDDLIYLGYIEADVEFRTTNGLARMKLAHYGGGSAYAISYKPQKVLDSFMGGEKPNILILGHYHKAEMFYYRNVYCIQAGCTKDQDEFLRKGNIASYLGGWILEFSQSQDGAINRFKGEFLNFFDKEYYRKWGYIK